MKKLLLLMAGIALSSSLMAQNGKHTMRHAAKRAVQETPAVYENGILRPEAVLWSQNFSTSTGISFAQTTASSNGWKIVTAFEPNIVTSPQNFGSTLNSLSGQPFAFINSDSFPNGTQNSSIILKVGTSLVGINGVQLSFQHYFRRFQEQHIVEVSNDSTNWTIVYNSQASIPVNTTITNATLEEINISSVAANQANVWIRFRYVGVWDWFWAVDDVEISDLPPNDLKLEDYSFVSEKRLAFYGTNPKNHKNDSITFEAAVLNFGTNAQPNTRMTSTFSQGANVLFNNVSSGVLIAGGVRDTLTSSAGYNLNSFNGTGELSAKIVLSSDSVDGSPANNEITMTCSVGDTIMSVARPNPTRTTSLGTASFGADSYDGFIIMSLIETSETDTITHVRLRLGTSTPGALIQITVRDTAGLFGTPPGGIDYPVLLEADLYTLTAADTQAREVVIPIPTTIGGIGQNRVLAAGAYFVAAELYSQNGANNIRIIDDLTYERFQPTYASLIYIPADATWYTNGISSAVEGVFANVGTTSVNELDNSTFSFKNVYPNPAQDVLNMVYTLKKDADVAIIIRDIAGRELAHRSAERQTIGEQRIEMDLHQLNSGIYFVELISNGLSARQKFIVSK